MQTLTLAPAFLVALVPASLFGSCTAGPPPPRGIQWTAHEFDPWDGHPNFTGHLTLARGKYDHDTRGSSLKGDTDAGLFRLLAEGSSDEGFGGGLIVEVLRSDSDLFQDAGFNPAEAGLADVFGYFLYQFTPTPAFRMPSRLGLFVSVLSLEDQVSADELDWVNVGLRFGLEPEVVLAQADRFQWSLFADVGAGVAATSVQMDAPSISVDDSFRSTAFTTHLELGTRFRGGAFYGGLSFLRRGLNVAESEERGGVKIRGIDTSFTGLALTLGLRF